MKTLDPTSPAARDLASGRYVIRTQTPQDMATITVPWMAAAGWNPGRHDAASFMVADPAGFLIGELDGEPIAAVSGVRYGDDFAFLGCYIVQEPFRGHGYGLAIHEAARRRLVGCVQGGDAVIENIHKYEQIGRVLAYRNTRFEGPGPVGRAFPGDPTVAATDVPFQQVAELDRTCFPAPRDAFLRAWLAQPEGIARAVVGADGELRGYGVARPAQSGYRVGPLFALDAASAEAIFLAICARMPAGQPVVLDVAEPNEAAVGMAQRYGLVESFAAARMYTGPRPDIRLDRVFGVSSFELG